MEGSQSKRQTLRTLSPITEADLIFQLDAAELGYLDRPRGLSVYYRAFGMLPPRYLTEAVPKIELTNFDLNRLVDSLRSRASA
jgi:hypothetical protein